MHPNQEVTALRKAGRLDEAYQKGRELLKEHPDDRYLANSFGWVLYDKVKELVEQANQLQGTSGEAHSEQLRQLLREYAKLKLPQPDLLFSRLLSQTLRFPGKLEFLPKFIKWAGLDSFRAEDYQTTYGQDDENKVFESLLEKTARTAGKVARDLQELELKDFVVALINKVLAEAQVRSPKWLNYHKALLLDDLGRKEEAKALLLSFVQENRSDYWTWHALAKIVEISDPALALALCAKACLTCSDPNFGVSVFEDLSRLAVHQGKMQLAKWATAQAFTVRSNNQWKISQSLREILNADWYSEAENLANPEEVLASIAADAEKVIWTNCPRYDANYLGTFITQKGKRMVKFGLFSDGASEELSSPARGLLNNLNLVLGDPVTVTVHESGNLSTVVVVEKRELGTPFDKLERVYGLVKHHWQGKAFVYLTPYKDCPLPYAEFPDIEKVSSGNAVEISCSRHGDRINPYRFSPSIFLENENISLWSGVFRLHQKGFGFVEDAFVPPDLASQLKDGQEVSLVVVKKLDKKKNKLSWTAIAILDECDRIYSRLG